MPQIYLWIVAVFLLVTVVAAYLRIQEHVEAPRGARAVLFIVFLGKLALLAWTAMLLVVWRDPLLMVVLT